MASFAPAEDGERVVLLNSGEATEERGRVADELLEAGAVFVNKSESNGRVTFFKGDVLCEPLRGVDISEPFASGVAAEFVDQGHGGGGVAGLISLYGDAMDDDFGKAVLWDNTRGRSERGGQYGAVSVHLVVGGFTGEGEDEVVREAGAPATREKGDFCWSASVYLINGRS
jgi:hypothetical protein